MSELMTDSTAPALEADPNSATASASATDTVAAAQESFTAEAQLASSDSAPDTVSASVSAPVSFSQPDPASHLFPPLSASVPLIENIQTAFSLGISHLDLRILARFGWNMLYDPQHSLNCCQLKLRTPKCSANIYPSGRVICVGTRSAVDSLVASRRVCRRVQKVLEKSEKSMAIEISNQTKDNSNPAAAAASAVRLLSSQVRFSDFKIPNMTGSCQLSHGVDLHRLVADRDLGDFTEYQPETFAACAYIRIPVELLDSESAKLYWNRDLSAATGPPAKSRSVTWNVFHSGHLKFSGAQSQQEIDSGFEILKVALAKFNTAKRESASHVKSENAVPHPSFQSRLAAAGEKRKMWKAQDEGRKRIKSEEIHSETGNNQIEFDSIETIGHESETNESSKTGSNQNSNTTISAVDIGDVEWE